ncbi:MAG: ATP-dependent DNA helicase RecG [Bacillota bacterium]|nr:ATP-dependent DNA helicase RecG [Bacillota bacterium]
MEEVLALIQRERQAGCCDAVVFGGFGLYLAEWAEERGLARLAEAGRCYAGLALEQRGAALAEMEEMLRALPPDSAAPLPKPKPAAHPGAKAPILSMPLTTLPGCGSRRAELFARLGLRSLGDLLLWLPRDYRDRRAVTPIGQAAPGSQISLRGTILGTEILPTKGRVTVLKCYLQDESGVMPLLWFNQTFLQKKLSPGRRLLVYGTVEKRFRSLELTVQDYQILEEGELGGGIVPVYAATEGLNQKSLRSAVSAAYQRCAAYIEDIVPLPLREKRMLMGRREAIRCLHFPENFGELEFARRSLAYEELLCLELALAAQAAPRAELQRPRDPSAPGDEELLRQFSAALPFSLTEAQQRVIREIYSDMSGSYAMSRLVQGDVGSGKTAVAAAAIYKCFRSGRQAALMAPTEILASQHYQSLLPLLTKLGLSVSLLTGSTKSVERKAQVSQLKAGVLDCLIGTHALIQEGVDFQDLGLAITDEQHRFGVSQRARLRRSNQVDMLVMTATPIPRTLAMTLYGDLDLSVIDQLPPGRQPIRTYAVDYSYEQRIYRFLEKEISQGRQAFIVCPLVEESEKVDLESATALFESLRQEVFPHRRLALLHGRMKPAEKEEVMQAFYQGHTDILVSTTVVEVGVNVPNASIMLIRDAERFGLAQLHQLRGRIGRGSQQSHCILLHNAKSDVARARMRIISSTSDGFALAEADLRQRGPGEFFGQRQHGLPELRVADLSRDEELLEMARLDAKAIREGQLESTDALEAASRKLLDFLLQG